MCTVHVVARSHLYMYVACNAVEWRPLMCGVFLGPMHMLCIRIPCDYYLFLTHGDEGPVLQ